MTCGLFNRYRDGELGRAQKEEFEAHLPGCARCRSALAVLDNLARTLLAPEGAPLRPPVDDIARSAFEHGRGWDARITTWLRPAPAWAAVALLSLAFAVLWLVPVRTQRDPYSEYEMILRASESAGGSTHIHNEEDLVQWLEQEGISP